METRAAPHHAWMHTAAQTWLVLIAVTLTLALWHPGEAATSYSFRPLNINVAGVANPVITGMNLGNILVGSYPPYFRSGSHGPLSFRGLGSTVYVPMPLLDIRGINNANDIVGSYAIPDDGTQVGFFLSGGRLEEIGFTQSEAGYTVATSVNDTLTVVGETYMWNANRYVAFRWTSERDLELIPDPPFLTWGGVGATAINNHGDIVGGYEDWGWALIDGFYHNLRVPGSNITLPLSINDARQVGGVFCQPGGYCAGFFYDPTDGTLQTIAVPGATYTEVRAGYKRTGKVAVNATVNGVYRGYIGTRR